MKIKKADETAKIRQAYVNAVPDICDVILSDCKTGKGQMIMMEEKKKNRKTVKYMLAAAACLILMLGGGFGLNAYHIDHKVVSTVSLEVNPSVQIMVNGKERVLDVKALNKDGEIVIGDMDFSGSDINVTVNALIGSMLRNGYLNELANSILISVDNEDPAQGAALQEKLTKEVNKLLESDGFTGAVLSQTISGNSSLQEQADQYGITSGKAQLIEQILSSTQGHTFEELAPLSINELNLILTTAGSGTDKVSASGNASDKAYIGELKAREIALAHAGISEGYITVYKVDMDVENGVMVYEIEFVYEGYEYEYDIDARTGEIVKNKKEVDDDALTAPDEKFVPQPSDSTNTVEDHYFEPDPSYNYHHSEPDHNGMYDGGGTHHEDSHHGGAYYNGNSAGTGNNADTGNGTGTGGSADTSALITVDQAKEIALNHAGQTADAVRLEKAKQDYDDGVLVYEIEFSAGGTEYEYEIDARTGAVRDYEWDYD